MSELTNQQFTTMLKRSGRLISGEVLSVTQTPCQLGSMMSQFFELQLSYSDDASGSFPAQCLMKMVAPEMFRIGKAEVEFYELANAQIGARPAPLIESYGTLVDEEQELAVVLMEEVGATISQSDWPVPQQYEICRRSVGALAEIHAHWWGSAEAEQARVLRAAPQQDAGRLASCTDSLIDKLGDVLSSRRRDLMEEVVRRYPDLHAARLASTPRQTIVHGDAHLWNFLIPSDEHTSSKLIDWQLWGVDFGVADLAYLMALHWFPERRERYEQSLLAHYVDELQRNGVDYSFDSAWMDYRFMVAGLLTKVVIYASVLPANIWWPHLERAFLAFDDLECGELLDRMS